MKKKNILPEGTRDLILDECIVKRAIERDIDDIFYKWGYKEIITPTVEFYETFNHDSQTLKEEDMYKFFDNRGRILVLRPDMTIPIARVVETKFKDESLPIKLRYNSNVFRVHASLGGKRNEYTDCGVELIGLEDKKSDLEVLVLALEALEKLGLSDFKLEIGNIGFFEGVFKTLNISKESKEIIAQYIEDKNLKNLEDYLDEIDIKDEYKEFFNKLPWLFGDRSILEEAKVLAFNEELKANLEYLENLYSELDILGYGNKVTFDLGMVPRLNYYTGIIFRGYGEGVGNTVLRGGRYDNLITIGEEYIPAIGFSLDINSVIENVKISEKINTIDKSCKIYYSSKYRIEAIRKSEKLRQEGKIVELIPDDSVNEIKVLL
ncbi:ATP phosphoribosyltransferase regulatory subunit [Clostridium butyricum]|jgi:ATP phosphoribosyltransferase regulatory subunit|uniref:ATP phosphoribosyltransferase regulatory subunit n=1 Tax=Clostridium butyricum TaxID=1492 RepID=A0A512TI99_CLOBU|nr:ATP phosphoribosyltransferase regulatory subunit [Clostridium butyricum]ETI88692.1 MAG: ATP phosphoribosyltransferase, regulatory subunit [Clostridium butyricum DORA_1]MDU1508944.1 ATP phosphoribosyltransferase regulatory subunit [Clostridium butyricum]MDU4802250.1 ATP phosphoribosyltransferase regulatory subunit [Clostridium butyricum]NAS17745.1 ATP phosphoribosyltransferase regulatory subunit [Clostridium butyricum]NOW22849.1 ATP phosphoribosyltransferase regulatory subunit [Clostridium b